MPTCQLFMISQDNVPLASLPLLGYSVSKPTEMDGIRREYVVKLQFKNHIYFFRADSAYTYNRWPAVRWCVYFFCVSITSVSQSRFFIYFFVIFILTVCRQCRKHTEENLYFPSNLNAVVAMGIGHGMQAENFYSTKCFSF